MTQPDTATAENEQQPDAKPKPAIPLNQRAALSPAEAAAMLGIARATLYRLISSGRLQTFTLGRARRISMRAIDAFIATREGA